MNRPKTAVIVTFPRSGSSLLAGVVHRLGVPMGEESELDLGRHLNRHGCHEDQEMQRISLNILFEAGLLLDLERRLEIDERRLERVVRRYDRDMAAFVGRHTDTVWGFKDPSLIYSLPYLHHHLQEPRYLVLLRDTEATARSLYTTFRASTWLPELREKLPLFTWRNRLLLVPHAIRLRLTKSASYHRFELFERVVEAGHDRIREFVSGRPHLAIELEDLAAEPDRVIDEICRFLELSPSDEQRNAARAFVEPDLLTAGRDEA
jgi:hypothetical protein